MEQNWRANLVAAAVLLVVVWTAFFGAYSGRSQQPAPSAREQGQVVQQPAPSKETEATKHDRGTEQRPLIVRSQRAPRSQTEAEQDADYQQRKAADENAVWFAWWTLGALVTQTVVLTLTLVVAGIVAVKQLRAYIGADIRWLHSFDETSFVRVRVMFTNTGSTPAYRLRHRIGFALLDEPLPEDATVPDFEDGFSAPFIVHGGAGLVAVHTAGERFSADEIWRIRDGTVRLYIFGKVIYRDTFLLKHYTRFCNEVRSDPATLIKLTSSTTEGSLNAAFAVAPIGNSST
jgi:hypothetical protein